MKFDERGGRGGKVEWIWKIEKVARFVPLGFLIVTGRRHRFIRRRTILETVVVPQIILLSTSYSSICFLVVFFFSRRDASSLVSFRLCGLWVSELQEISIEVKYF